MPVDEGDWDGVEEDRAAPASPLGDSTDDGTDVDYCPYCGAAVEEDAARCQGCGARLDESGAGARTGKDLPPPSSRLVSVGAGAVVTLVVGGVLSVLGALVPIVGFLFQLAGPVLGGAVAGYLRGPNMKESTLVGGLAVGTPSLLFLVLLVPLFVLGLGIGATPGGDLLLGAGVVGGFALASVVAAAATGALGGAIGAQVSNRQAPTVEEE